MPAACAARKASRFFAMASSSAPAKAGTAPSNPKASAGNISVRRSIFIVSSVVMVGGSFAAAPGFVEHACRNHARCCICERATLTVMRSCNRSPRPQPICRVDRIGEPPHHEAPCPRGAAVTGLTHRQSEISIARTFGPGDGGRSPRRFGVSRRPSTQGPQRSLRSSLADASMAAPSLPRASRTLA